MMRLWARTVKKRLLLILINEQLRLPMQHLQRQQ